jgi:hypothetical protein
VELLAPKPGDPEDYLVLRTADGRRVALTNTCAANALGVVRPDDYARGDRDAALAAFAVAGAALRIRGEEVARRMLQASVQAVGDLVDAVTKAHHLEGPTVVAVGGGAGALGRAVAGAMNLEIVVPERAEVISAIGDALSLIRAEREQTFERPTAADTQALIADVEDEAIRAGAAASSLDVRVEHIAERGAVRVTVTGAVGLNSGALPGRAPATEQALRDVAARRNYDSLSRFGQYWLARTSRGDDRVAVFDVYGDLVIDVRGETLDASTGDIAAIEAALERRTRRVGPVTIDPDVWIVGGARFLQATDTHATAVREAAQTLTGAGEATTIIIGRE